MNENLTLLTQSRFYSPALNAAIFDGPVRLYFDQSQEAGALKLYFAILNHFKKICGGLQSEQMPSRISVFVMIYPSTELFQMICPSDEKPDMLVDHLGSDFVIALNGMPDNDLIAKILLQVEKLLPLEPMAPEQTL